MLGGVREGFRHDVVGGHLDPLRQPSLGARVELDGHGGAAGERLDRGHQPAFGQDRRVDPARDLAEVLERAVQPLGNPRHLHLHLCKLGRHRQLGGS